jgi:hypothetical protein
MFRNEGVTGSNPVSSTDFPSYSLTRCPSLIWARGGVAPHPDPQACHRIGGPKHLSTCEVLSHSVLHNQLRECLAPISRVPQKGGPAPQIDDEHHSHRWWQVASCRRSSETHQTRGASRSRQRHRRGKPRNLTIQHYRAVGTVPARVEICSAARWVYHLHLVPVRASVGWLRTLTPISTRISALTCSVFLERHVNEETLPSPQTSAASTPSRADGEVLAG